MKLVAKFLDENGTTLGWNEDLLTNSGIKNIFEVENIIEKLEKYLDENEKLNLKTYTSKETINSLDVRGIYIKEKYFGDETLDLKVNWKHENSHLTRMRDN